MHLARNVQDVSASVRLALGVVVATAARATAVRRIIII
jgi:hypothetical protein